MTPLADPDGPEQFRDLVANRFGLKFDDAKLPFLGEIVQRRSAAHRTSVEGYLAGMAADATEAALLAEELTVGETYFFRNNDQFRALCGHVIPERMEARRATQRLSFLSAGCSSGEEPYTIAMLAQQYVPSPPWQVSIRAADLNPAALRKARAARFGAWALRETPDMMRDRWFVPDGRDMLLRDELKQAVTFDRRNLADDSADIWQDEVYDVVFCRNVIMYFTIEVQEAVVSRIARSLAPGGYLFLGHAETLRGLSQDFHLVHSHDTFYYQRRAAGEHARTHHRAPEPDYRPLPVTETPLPAPLDGSWYAAINEASQRIAALTLPEPAVAAEPAPQWNLEAALDLWRSERFGEALAQIGALPADARSDPDVQLLEALLLAQGGRYAAAGEVCRALLESDEFHAGARYVLGLCFEGMTEPQAAIDQYGMASHLDPQFAMPLLRRGLLERRLGQFDAARADLGGAIELLHREDSSRLLLFGGGFTRTALARLCETELQASRGAA